MNLQDYQREEQRITQDLDNLRKQRGDSPEKSMEEKLLEQQLMELKTPVLAESRKMSEAAKIKDLEADREYKSPVEVPDRAAWKNFSPDIQQHALQLFPSLKQFETKAPEEKPEQLEPKEEMPSDEAEVDREPATDSRFFGLLGDVLEREGGYRAKVKGDYPTMKGITLPTYRAYLNNPKATEEDLKKISDDDIQKIYQRYYKEVGGNKIVDPRVATVLFDQNVNKGTRFINDIQDYFGHPKSSKLEKETIDAINSTDPEEFTKDLLDKTRQDYFNIAEKIPSKRKELSGWLNRLDDLYAKVGISSPSESKDNYVEMRKPEEPEFKPIDIQKTIKDVTEKEKQAELFKAMAKARDAAMGLGLGKSIPTDYTMYDKMAEQAKTPLRNIALQREMEDEQAKNDPNSQISILTKKSLEELGMNMQGLEKVSYSQLEKLYPSLTQSLYTKIAAQAKAGLAQQSAADKKLTQQQALKEKKFNELNRRAEKVLADKDIVKTYRDTSKTQKLIDSAIRNWNSSDDDYKAAAQAGFVSYAKQAQGDESVLRESDIKVLAGGYNFGSLSKLVSKFAAKASGSDFSPQELKEFAAVIRTIKDIKKKELQTRLNPILKTAKDYDVDTDQIFDPTFISDVYSPTIEEKEARLKELKEKAKKAKQK